LTRSVEVAIDLRLAGYRGGGIARYANDLVDALRGEPGIRAVPIRSAGDPVHDPGYVRFLTPPHHRLERYAIPVEMLLHRLRPDVYHAVDFIAPILPGVPRVATVHDLSFVHWPQDLASDGLAYYRQLERSKQDTAAWITPSEWTAKDLATVYGIARETIHVVPHGISLDLFAEPPLPREERKPYLLAVGTIEPRKQYPLLLDALRIARAAPDLVVVGQPGWNSEDIELRLATEARVNWRRGVDDLALRTLYREALAVVMPSRAEGFGLPALEAMAAGTPVVSSGGGALMEVTGDAALTVPEAAAEVWAEALERIATDTELWQRLSVVGRERAATFTWERAARETADVYRRVTNASRPSRGDG
jgi:glycosyltransferase involved in cell wall biosynthesis